MSPRQTLLVALLVALAGCTGASAPGGSADDTTAGTATTVEPTTQPAEPHTAEGTSHAGSHLVVRALLGVENVTVTLAPDGQTASYAVEPSPEHSFTREIHDRGHDVRVVVERDGEVVFDQDVRDYQFYQLTVHENETSVTQSVV